MLKQQTELWQLLLVAVILAAAILWSHQQHHVEMGEAVSTHDHELHDHDEELHAIRNALEEEIHALREEVAELKGHMAHDEEGDN